MRDLMKDASRESLVNALRSFADEAETADWALVYYAGHGVEIGGINYLLPVDVKLATDRDVQFEDNPIDQVLASIEQAKKLRLVFLDARRDNPFLPNMRRTPKSGARRTRRDRRGFGYPVSGTRVGSNKSPIPREVFWCATREGWSDRVGRRRSQ